MLGAGIGDPGGSGVSRPRASKKPGVEEATLGRSGASLVSRECVTEPGRDMVSIESEAKGSSPTSDDELSLAVPGPVWNALGGRRAPEPAAAAAPAVGPMTSSTMLLRSTEFDAFTMGSTS